MSIHVPTVRAKFRCLQITETWDKSVYIELAPVIPSSGDEAASIENKRFWKYTPSGKARLHYFDIRPFHVGAFYYVDFTPDVAELERRAWRLRSIDENEHSLRVSFNVTWEPEPFRNGDLEMQIDNRDCWPHFYGKIMSRWSISFAETT